MRILAFSVHVLTACGAAFALMALIAAARGDWAPMFLSLGFALIVDAVDGPLARRLNVVATLPRWSGETLDLIVDFTTYVFVPAYAIATSGLMLTALAVPAGVAIVMTGALYFADRKMKTADNYFRGFPAVWNLVAFYLLLLQPAPWLATMAVASFAVLTFLPVRFVHPFRVARMRAMTIALLAVWAILALVAVANALAPEPWITVALCAIGLYFLAVGLVPMSNQQEN
jgi:phosphatidylcholine synthase